MQTSERAVRLAQSSKPAAWRLRQQPQRYEVLKSPVREKGTAIEPTRRFRKQWFEQRCDASKKRKLEILRQKFKKQLQRHENSRRTEDCLSKFTARSLAFYLPWVGHETLKYGGRVTGNISSRTHTNSWNEVRRWSAGGSGRKCKMASSQSGCRILGENDMIQLSRRH